MSASIDREATRAEQAALASHLESCSGCRAWAALTQSVALQIRTAEPSEPERLVWVPPQRAPRRLGGARATRWAVAMSTVAVAAGYLLAASPSSNAPPGPTSGRSAEVTVALNTGLQSNWGRQEHGVPQVRISHLQYLRDLS